MQTSRLNRARIIVFEVLLLWAFTSVVPGLARRTVASPQTALGSISGQVTVTTSEGATNSLADIPVKLTAPENSSQTTVTDSEGRYSFTGLQAGSYTLEVTLVGFKTWTATVTMAPGQAAIQDAALQLSPVEEKVEVNAEATELSTESASPAGIMNEQQLESLPIRTAQFTEALSLSPSVIKTQEGTLNFNGQAESQGMLLVDSAETVDPVSGSFAIPIPVDAIESMKVYSAPESAEFGGFSGGLTRIDLKSPPAAWSYSLGDFVPSFRAKNQHVIGLSNVTPRVAFGGPILPGKLNFAEDFTYEFRRDPVRGLSWPVNETYTYSLVSLTEFQWIFSSKHLLSVNFNVFPTTNLYTNIDSLIPQTASTNFHRRGVTVGVSDAHEFDSGLVLNTVLRYTNFYSNSSGQGFADMQILPEGWGGNFFNSWFRNANQLEAIPSVQLPAKKWHGTHEIKFGTEVLYRTFRGSSASRPVELLAEGASVSQAGPISERIDFQGQGMLRATETEVSEFVEDHWTPASRLSLNFGSRLTTQTLGRGAGFAPHAGVAYGLAQGKIVVRAGTGLIYGHVPLLAADFTNNQERILSFYDPSGNLIGAPITLQNVYMPDGLATSVPVVKNLGSSPRTFAWNVEVERELRNKDLIIRLVYLETHTTDLFVVDPILPAVGSSGFLALENTGVSHFRQAQVNVHYRLSSRGEFDISYSWSRARGDLNTLSDTFVPFEAPVIRPNQYGIQPADIPHRVVASGFVRLPWKMILSPVVDAHSGYAYSNIDVLQNYVGPPNSSRFATYFAVDAKLYRDFAVHLPFQEHSKTHKIRFGAYTINGTNHHNYHDVYNNVASPLFGQFAGFQRRITGLVIGLGE
jgi:hypothetical protein